MAARPLVVPEIVAFPVDVDEEAAELLASELLAAFRPGVAVVLADLSKTEGCDSRLIRRLIAVSNRAVCTGAEFRVVVGDEAIRQRIQLLGADRVLRLYGDVKSALTGPPGLDSPPVLVAGALAEADASEQPQSVPSEPSRSVSPLARLRRRLSAMAVIEQAKGILMHHERCTADTALQMLRCASDRSDIPVSELAAEIVERASQRRP